MDVPPPSAMQPSPASVPAPGGCGCGGKCSGGGAKISRAVNLVVTVLFVWASVVTLRDYYRRRRS